MNQPRPEHPKPQFMRDEWINLNGEWTFRTENRQPFHVRSETLAAACESTGFDRTITVPFAPESPLSGVGEKEFITSMWYHRTVEVPATWEGKAILLHFGAVFYQAEVFLDGKFVGRHVGGSVSFHFDISAFVSAGKSHNLVVAVTNNLWDGTQPSGKQSWKYDHYGCFYTRTTGIWQTVWLEAMDPVGFEGVQIIPDADSGRFTFIPRFRALASGQTWEAAVSFAGAEACATRSTAADGMPLQVEVPDPKRWEPGTPALYDIEFRVLNSGGKVIDRVKSYAGLRKVHIEGSTLFLNDEPVYLRLVLDQGFYPDGIWTAPSDAALKRDIELSIKAGFNGARLHQKVFEERFLYWADKMGYLLWGESASWGLDYNQDGMPHRNFLSEWREIVARDRNHPAIIAWTPFNETRNYSDPKAHQRLHDDAYYICKMLDPTRPVNDASGYIHHITDLYTVHNYTQDPKALSALLADTPDRGVFRNFPENDAPYTGQPYYIDEFGGIKWNPETQNDSAMGEGQNLQSWGYGRAPRSLEEFYSRLEGLVKSVTNHTHIAGWCYTQLTDVEQEQNGIYFFDRTPKFDIERIRKIFLSGEK